jgi:iron complex outermembrane receptor protein
MGAFEDKQRENYAFNDPTMNGKVNNYDSDYPIVLQETGASGIDEDNTTYMETWNHHLSYIQPSPLGKFNLGVSYTFKPEHYFSWIGKFKKANKGKEGKYSESPNSKNKHLALKMEDEISLFEGNKLTLGFDSIDFWTSSGGETDNNVRDHKSCFIEDIWQLADNLELRLGLRYEEVNLSINNYSEKGGWGSKKGYQVTLEPPEKYIEKEEAQFLPKSFLTYQLDDLWAPLRDTSVSLGLSKVWNVAPFCLV